MRFREKQTGGYREKWARQNPWARRSGRSGGSGYSGAAVSRWSKRGIRRVILAAGLLAVWLVRLVPSWGEAYARHIYPVLARGLSFFSGLFPFSLGDCLIYGSIAGLALYGAAGLWRRRPWMPQLWGALEYLGWLYLWFYLAWGLNYFREDFFTRNRLRPPAYDAASFRQFLSAYTDSLNACYVPVDAFDKTAVSAEIKKKYREIAQDWHLPVPPSRLEPKTMLWSSLMSGVGVMGYMGPFTNEFNLNRELLPVQYPAVYAHEMAHVLGIAGEAEANFFSYLVCTRSEMPGIRFAGYFSLFPYVLSNAYRLLDEAEFTAWKERLRPEIRALYNRKAAYWEARYNPWIGKGQDVLYNWFLKGNRIASGTANYSEVVALVMAADAAGRIEGFSGR